MVKKDINILYKLFWVIKKVKEFKLAAKIFGMQTQMEWPMNNI
jgi:hypothetical protein